jgi:hypothetical protein
VGIEGVPIRDKKSILALWAREEEGPGDRGRVPGAIYVIPEMLDNAQSTL